MRAAQRPCKRECSRGHLQVPGARGQALARGTCGGDGEASGSGPPRTGRTPTRTQGPQRRRQSTFALARASVVRRVESRFVPDKFFLQRAVKRDACLDTFADVVSVHFPGPKDPLQQGRNGQRVRSLKLGRSLVHSEPGPWILYRLGSIILATAGPAPQRRTPRAGSAPPELPWSGPYGTQDRDIAATLTAFADPTIPDRSPTQKTTTPRKFGTHIR